MTTPSAIIEPSPAPADETQVETRDRKTFVVPEGFEAVRDADGRVTGAIRQLPAKADTRPS